MKKGGGKYRGASVTHRRLYAVWKSMLARCAKSDHRYYADYGGRGITVCEEWQKFLAFLSWSFSSGYRHGLTIDRINNDGGYSPGNCRWATQKQQLRNRRNNVLIEYQGRTMCIGELAELAGIPSTTMRQRIVAYGWTIERAVSTPVARAV